MKITNINIENFKEIDSLQFNPRMLNIFVGRNNTGKTSILQAIDLAFDEDEFSFFFLTQPSAALKYGENKAKLEMKLVEDKRSFVGVEINREIMKELISELENKVNVTFETALKRVQDSNRKTLKNEEKKRRAVEIEKELKERINSELILEMVDKVLLTESAKESVNLIVNGKKQFLTGLTIYIMTEKIVIQIAEKLNIMKFFGWSKSRTSNFMKISQVSDQFNKYLHSLYETENSGKEEENVSSPIFITDPIDAINKVKFDKKRLEGIAHEIEQIIINDNIVPGLTRFNFNKMVFEGVEEDVSMDSMGDGFKALIGILASLYQRPKNTIVLLEEPEVHMHPGYLQELAKYLVILSRTRNIQLFISTHSMDFIQCFLNFDSLSPVDSEFVRSQFFMLQLSHLKNVVVSEEIDYYEADQTIKDLELDLRGI